MGLGSGIFSGLNLANLIQVVAWVGASIDVV